MRFSQRLAVGVETTRCGQLTIRRREMEAIKIGALRGSADTLEPIVEYSAFVRPYPVPAAHLILHGADGDLARPGGFGSDHRWRYSRIRGAGRPLPRIPVRFLERAYGHNEIIRECRNWQRDCPLRPKHFDRTSRFAQRAGSRKLINLDHALERRGVGPRRAAASMARRCAKRSSFAALPCEPSRKLPVRLTARATGKACPPTYPAVLSLQTSELVDRGTVC